MTETEKTALMAATAKLGNDENLTHRQQIAVRDGLSAAVYLVSEYRDLVLAVYAKLQHSHEDFEATLRDLDKWAYQSGIGTIVPQPEGRAYKNLADELHRE